MDGRFRSLLDHVAGGRRLESSAARTRRGNALRAVRLLVRVAMRRFLSLRRTQLSKPIREKFDLSYVSRFRSAAACWCARKGFPVGPELTRPTPN
jgi:hypothetical protein